MDGWIFSLFQFKNKDPPWIFFVFYKRCRPSRRYLWMILLAAVVTSPGRSTAKAGPPSLLGRAACGTVPAGWRRTGSQEDRSGAGDSRREEIKSVGQPERPVSVCGLALGSGRAGKGATICNFGLNEVKQEVVGFAHEISSNKQKHNKREENQPPLIQRDIWYQTGYSRQAVQIFWSGVLWKACEQLNIIFHTESKDGHAQWYPPTKAGQCFRPGLRVFICLYCWQKDLVAHWMNFYEILKVTIRLQKANSKRQLQLINLNLDKMAALPRLILQILS